MINENRQKVFFINLIIKRILQAMARQIKKNNNNMFFKVGEDNLEVIDNIVETLENLYGIKALYNGLELIVWW